MRICDHWPKDPQAPWLHLYLHTFISECPWPSMAPFWASIPSLVNVHGPPLLHFEPLKLLNFDSNADPDPAFYSNADPDPASRSNADPSGYGSGSAALQLPYLCIKIFLARGRFCTWSQGKTAGSPVRSSPCTPVSCKKRIFNMNKFLLKFWWNVVCYLSLIRWGGNLSRP
jgi:hypothetical protein